MSREAIRVYRAVIDGIPVEVSGDLYITHEVGGSNWEAFLLTHESLPSGLARGHAGPVDIIFAERSGGLAGRASIRVEVRPGIGGSMTRILAKGTGGLERHMPR